DLEREFRKHARNHRQNMPCAYRPSDPFYTVPPSLVRTFRLEGQRSDGAWHTIARVEENHQRLVRVPLKKTVAAIRFVPEATWGAEHAHVFSWDVR
ncbi:MAG: hypothetical protein QHJ73_12440, partial [Armatimonadota bacterium]|nr:hypothetical protein [Armatimonadota bacterium]